MLKTPLLALYLPKSCTDDLYNARTTNRYLRGKGERNGVQRRTEVNFVRTMMQALELLWLVKRHVSGQSDIEQ